MASEVIGAECSCGLLNFGTRKQPGANAVCNDCGLWVKKQNVFSRILKAIRG